MNGNGVATSCKKAVVLLPAKSSSVNMDESEWEKEKPKLLKMIEEKQDQLNDFEKRFFPVTIDDEREALKEKTLLKQRDLLKSKIDTIKHEIEILQLKKKLKELEEENASLSLSSKNS